MNELRPIGWYSSRVAQHLPKEAFKPAPTRLWGGLVFLALTVGGIFTVGIYNLNPFAYIALSIVIAMGFSGMGFLAHEILHGTVVKKAWLRDLLGGIAFAQFWIGSKLWRKWHNMEHHAHTQDEDTDPDAWATMEEFYKRPAMVWIYRLPAWFRALASFSSFTIFFTLHGLLQFRAFIGTFKPRDRVVVSLQLILPIVLWTSVLAWMGPYRFLFAYVLPFMMANFLVISYISTNHQLNPLTDVNDPLANSLSVTVPNWVDVINMNFSLHTEHHLFPGMNAKWAPLVKAEIKRQWPDRYHEMPFTQAMATLWRTPRIYHNHTDLVDPYRANGFGTLGHGLKPSAVKPHGVQLKQRAEAAPAGPVASFQEGD